MRTLKRLLPSQDIDALLGDIAEESGHRSRFWLWMQFAAAVVVGSTREMRKHPFLALRAIATGCVTLTIYFGAVLAMSQVVWVLSNGGYYVGGYWLTLPPHPLPRAPYDMLTALAVNALGFVLSGWAIARLHRAHGIAMAMPFLATMTSLALIPLTIVVTDTGPGTRTMPLMEMVLTFGTLFLSIPVGVLLGGALGVRWKPM